VQNRTHSFRRSLHSKPNSALDIRGQAFPFPLKSSSDPSSYPQLDSTSSFAQNVTRTPYYTPNPDTPIVRFSQDTESQPWNHYRITAFEQLNTPPADHLGYQPADLDPSLLHAQYRNEPPESELSSNETAFFQDSTYGTGELGAHSDYSGQEQGKFNHQEFYELNDIMPSMSTPSKVPPELQPAGPSVPKVPEEPDEKKPHRGGPPGPKGPYGARGHKAPSEGCPYCGHRAKCPSDLKYVRFGGDLIPGCPKLTLSPKKAYSEAREAVRVHGSGLQTCRWVHDHK
jgi:hypothetical protein